jgi:TonB family protein
MEEAKAAPPPVSGPPTVAPPAAELPSFEFEGGKAVETSSDPVHLYKGYLEYALRSKWQRPENVEDDKYVVEVAVTVDKQGAISNPVWEKGSGDPKWDESVKAVFKEVRTMDRPPPTNFPSRVTVRFDVQEETEPVLQ